MSNTYLRDNLFQDELIKKMKETLKEFYGDNVQKSKDLARMVNNRHFK